MSSSTPKTNDLLPIGSIVKISKPHLKNNPHWQQGGHDCLGKIISIGTTFYIVSNGMSNYACEFDQLIAYHGEVNDRIKNIVIRRKFRY